MPAKAEKYLIGAHRGRRGAVGEQPQLLLLDAVLHVATGAVQFFVEHLLGNRLPAKAGHHEARIAAVGTPQPLGLGHHPALVAPRVQRPVAELPKPPRCSPGRRSAEPRLAQRLADGSLQAWVARQTEHIVDALALTSRHNPFTTKS